MYMVWLATKSRNLKIYPKDMKYIYYITNMSTTFDFTTIAPDDFTFSPVKQNQMGGQTVYINMKREKVRLEVPKGRLPFGLNIQSYDDSATKMTIDQSLGNPSAQDDLGHFHRWLLSFDEHMINIAYINSDSWFKKKLSKEILTEFYKPSVIKSKNEKFDPTFKMKMPTKGDKTTVSIYNSSEEPTTQDIIEKGCHVRTIIELQSVWFVNKMFGVTWKVLQVQVFPIEKFTGFAFKRSIKHIPQTPDAEFEQDPPSPDPAVYDPYVPSDNSDNE